MTQPTMDTSPRREVVAEWLTARAGDSVELVCITKGGARARAFRLPDDVGPAVDWVTAMASPGTTLSASIGSLSDAAVDAINSRRWPRASGARALDEGVALLEGYRWVAVDLDPDHGPDNRPLQERMQILAAPLAVLPRPQRLVASGSGLHAWWRLTDWVDPETGRSLLEALVRATGSDPGVTSAVRALRLPGTFNHKPSAQRHAQFAPVLGDVADSVDPGELLTAAVANVLPLPVVPQRLPPRTTYLGDDARERVRAQHDLADLLDQACGPSVRGGWSCFAHPDRTPSLRLRQGSRDYAVCWGGSHPDDVGRRHDAYYVMDVFDILSWQNGISTSALLSALVTEERQNPARASIIPAGVAGLDQLLVGGSV